MSDNKYKILNKNKANSELELEVEVPYESVQEYIDQSVKELGEDLDLPGFRKGKIPENIIRENVGEMQIHEKAVYKTLNILVPIILVSEKIEVLDSPSISVTKIALKSPTVFKMKASLMPEFDLPDYKKIVSNVSNQKKLKLKTRKLMIT